MNVLHLLVAGSRGFAEIHQMLIGGQVISTYDIVKALIDGRAAAHDNAEVSIVEGGARGVDTMAADVARRNKWELYEMKANWELGRSAGYIRNSDMHKWLSQFPEREVLLIWDGVSKGTAHNFKLAKKYNNPLYCYLYREGRFMTADEIAALQQD